jgi:ATP/ADP translocase
MEKADLYRNMYEEHAEQARKHEEQRERITGLVLSIVSILIGFITFAKLSIVSLAVSIPIIMLGAYGYFFAGKHYERFKLHTKIMRAMRHELDALSMNDNHTGKSIAVLREEAEAKHYREFIWPTFSGGRSAAQNNATSWIARQRLHVFWEAIHLMIIVIGICLTISIVAKQFIADEPEIIKVQIIDPIKHPPSVNAGQANTHLSSKK